MSSPQSVAPPASRLRERLLQSLTKGNVSKVGKPTKRNSVAVLPIPQSIPCPLNFSSVEHSTCPQEPIKATEKSPQKEALKKKQALDTIDRPQKQQQKRKDHQSTRLLKRLPQAKVLGDVDLGRLIKKNDLMVVINEEADDINDSSSLDSSVADEKAGLRKLGLKSALIKSSNQLKLSKKVMFIGGERDGAEVSAIFLYEAVPVDVPWQVPKFRGEANLKAVRHAPPIMPAAMAFRPC